MQAFAPIALFVYNRPEHTRRTLKFLQQNRLAEESRLFIFSDAAKTPGQAGQVAEVRELIRTAEGFRSVEIIERDGNLGLAASVIDGVTRLVNEYGKVIVFEDDLISSPHTLQYFNDALDRYREEPRVMHIGAYMYPLPKGLPETFFYRAATSWGWATWKRAWDHFEPDIDVLMSRFDKKSIHEFSIGGSMDFWRQMKQFKAGKNNSWAIRWYASVFLKKGLTLNPSQSLINNIGHDNTGVHSGLNDMYQVSVRQSRITRFPAVIQEDIRAYQAIRHFLKNRKGSWVKRIIRFVRQRMN
ncbi:MAG TPA: sugar transferase [Sphingobacteriaceae bacterium]